jgi:hypothetical protein
VVFHQELKKSGRDGGRVEEGCRLQAKRCNTNPADMRRTSLSDYPATFPTHPDAARPAIRKS